MMKNSEIVDRYLRRNTSISILAQLNDCSTDEIIDILQQEGVELKQEKPHKKTGPKPKAEEEPKQEPAIEVKMPKRLAAYHQTVVKDIEDEITIHMELIAADEEQIRRQQKAIKAEIDRLARSLLDFENSKKEYIKDHKKAIKELNIELEEVKKFYKAYKGK